MPGFVDPKKRRTMLYDTLAVQLHIDDFALPDGDDFDWSKEHVESLVTQAMATTDQELESPIQFKEFLYTQLSERKSWSDVAYIESTEGYFFVTEALADHFTVTYSRWD